MGELAGAGETERAVFWGRTGEHDLLEMFAKGPSTNSGISSFILQADDRESWN